ncbi:MAG: cytochrome c oxidase assembly protein [Acidobacteriota bacterium]
MASIAERSDVVQFVAWPQRQRRGGRRCNSRLAQHELLMVVAAPLMAMSAPLNALLWAVPARIRRPALEAIRRPPVAILWAALTAPATTFLLHALALWIWLLPVLYDYALEHEVRARLAASLFFRHGGAVLVGNLIRAVRPRRLWGGSGLRVRDGRPQWRPRRAAHLRPPRLAPAVSDESSVGADTTRRSTACGLLMWVPASVIFAGGGLVLFALWLRESDRRSRYQLRISINPTP